MRQSRPAWMMPPVPDEMLDEDPSWYCTGLMVLPPTDRPMPAMKRTGLGLVLSAWAAPTKAQDRAKARIVFFIFFQWVETGEAGAENYLFDIETSEAGNPE